MPFCHSSPVKSLYKINQQLLALVNCIIPWNHDPIVLMIAFGNEGQIEKYRFVTEGHSVDFFINTLGHGYCPNILVNL